MNSYLKYITIGICFILVAGLSTCAIISKKLPDGIVSPKSELLANKIWKSLNKDAWDHTRYIKWSFRGKHNYIWDKQANLTQISWEDNRVLLNPNTVTGTAYNNESKLSGEQSDKLIQKAWSYWCNDMYWLIAPFKIKDQGTTLSIVEHPEGDRLKVSYTSGGVTPGDSYIWILDNSGKPIGYEMYTSIIPIQGVKSSWEGWTSISTGAIISTEHKTGKISLKMKGVSGGNQLNDVGLSTDIWQEIRN